MLSPQEMGSGNPLGSSKKGPKEPQQGKEGIVAGEPETGEAPGQLQRRFPPQERGGVKAELRRAAGMPRSRYGNGEIGTSSLKETLIGYFWTTGS